MELVTPKSRLIPVDVGDHRPSRWAERDWRRGFVQGSTGLDCLSCGARIGSRPELADRHRRWHVELESQFGGS
ncbi:hypothetical protein GCM10023168_03170 [Fodinibacter luteus]|uniref:C2H2-type domain-containing protein n=1 Tax=Fodinibacter luteus TaxID=552064 RepID=A0ABP8JYW2_9MICO